MHIFLSVHPMSMGSSVLTCRADCNCLYGMRTYYSVLSRWIMLPGEICNQIQNPKKLLYIDGMTSFCLQAQLFILFNWLSVSWFWPRLSSINIYYFSQEFFCVFWYDLWWNAIFNFSYYIPSSQPQPSRLSNFINLCLGSLYEYD